jgi:hypothetical protein
VNGRRVAELAGREYLPMAATIAMWAVVVAATGHADAARLLAAVTGVRAIQLFTKFATGAALKRRLGAPRKIWRQARRFCLDLQLIALTVALLIVAILIEGMESIDQGQIAATIPFIAVGMPARYLRFADVRAATPYSRLALALCGLAVALIGWAVGWHATMFGLAFGAREWIAYLALRWWPTTPRPSARPTSDPLHFAEVASLSALIGRRSLTYRLSKSLLTAFGPFGTVAARTGRGLNWHKKIEPYVPHHLPGFILFSAVALVSAVMLVLKSGEPAAMVAAAGMFQIGAATTNVILLWRYLPQSRREPDIQDDDDDD